MSEDAELFLDSQADELDHSKRFLQALWKAWLNEKCSPELLQFEEEAVEYLNEAVKTQVNSSPRLIATSWLFSITLCRIQKQRQVPIAAQQPSFISTST